jgi:hypothetical protein
MKKTVSVFIYFQVWQIPSHHVPATGSKHLVPLNFQKLAVKVRPAITTRFCTIGDSP